MRRGLAALVAAAAVAAGCGDGDGPQRFTNPVATMRVEQDAEFELALDENPSTGYSWRFETRPRPAQIRLRGSDFEPEEGAEERAGSGGTRVYRFDAVGPGRTKWRMAYVGPDGRTVATRREFAVEVE